MPEIERGTPEKMPPPPPEESSSATAPEAVPPGKRRKGGSGGTGRVIRFFRNLGIGLLGLILFLAFSLLMIYRFPQLVANTRTATWAVKKFLPDLLDPTIPPNFEAKLTSPRWRHFQLEFNAENFCTTLQGALERSCFDQFHSVVGVHHSALTRIELERVGPIHIRSSQVTLHDTSRDPEVQPAAEEGGMTIDFGMASELDFRDINISLDEIRLSHLRAYPRITSLRALGTPRGRQEASLDLSFQAKLTAQDQLGVTSTWNMTEKRHLQGEMKVTSQLKNPKVTGLLNFRLVGDLEKRNGVLTGDGTLAGPSPNLGKTHLRKLHAVRQKSGALNAEVNLETTALIEGGPLGRGLRFPTEIRVESRFDPAGTGRSEIRLIGEAPAQAVTEGEALVNFSRGYAPESAQGSFRMRLGSFQALRRYLAGSPYEIPAPLRVLDGPVALDVEAEWKDGPPQVVQAYPVKFSTNLKSAEQRLALEGRGRFEIEGKKTPRLHLSLALQDVRLQLPGIDPVLPLPFPAGDDRIKQKAITPTTFQQEKRKDLNPALELFLDVKNGQPIELMHPMFDPSLRLKFTYHQDNQGSRVSLNFLPTQVKYLGRSATLKDLDLEMNSATGKMKVTGNIGMDRSGYKLNIEFSQEDKKTVVDMTSRPPLPQNEIISLILFNEVSTGIATEDQRAVEDTQSAIAGKALGFFSLWALASTPVESVHFDPSTQVYSAKVKLPGGVTAEVGSDWDRAREFELRKRLSRRWAITAGVKTDETGETSQESFLEWFYRY